MGGKSSKTDRNHIELKIDPRVYSRESIFAAGYVFLDRVYIALEKEKNKFVIRFYPKNKSLDLKKLALEFQNELLNYSHYASRIKANAEATRDIMQSALFPAPQSPVQEVEDKEIQELIHELEEEEKAEQRKKTRRTARNKRRK